MTKDEIAAVDQLTEESDLLHALKHWSTRKLNASDEKELRLRTALKEWLRSNALAQEVAAEWKDPK